MEKGNGKGETMKKLARIQEYNKFMLGMHRADQILHYYPCCRKIVKWTKKFVFFMLHLAALNRLILFKKYTTNQNQKGKGYAFEAFVLDFSENDGTRRKRRRER
jgi:hypothetical protein